MCESGAWRHIELHKIRNVIVFRNLAVGRWQGAVYEAYSGPQYDLKIRSNILQGKALDRYIHDTPPISRGNKIPSLNLQLIVFLPKQNRFSALAFQIFICIASLYILSEIWKVYFFLLSKWFYFQGINTNSQTVQFALLVYPGFQFGCEKYSKCWRMKHMNANGKVLKSTKSEKQYLDQ